MQQVDLMARISANDGPMRKYSWWWDSHICPKNSKWLQENLSDTDSSKMKVMIDIIDEDADSFARRAEMYYKRRPELMSLLEELYRAYRALAERYDHTAGELRQAHKKIAEAFPDEYQLDLDDDLPAEAASSETDTDNRAMTPFFCSFINTGDSKKRSKNDQDHEKLQKEISSLSQENQELKKNILSVLEKSERAESEVICLKEALAQQGSEKEAAVSQCQQSSDRLQNLESEILHTQQELRRLEEEMQKALQKLSTAEKHCLVLERANQDLHLELDKLKYASKEKHIELEKHSISIQEEQLKSMQAEMARLSLEQQLAQEQEKLRLLSLEKHGEASKLKDTEASKVRLQKELDEIREEKRKSGETGVQKRGVSQLIDSNSKLLKEFTSVDGLDGEILKRARKVSEKVGRLELEMKKFQQVLLERGEERASKVVQRRSRVQLVEYLYGKRGLSCCMRANAIDD